MPTVEVIVRKIANEELPGWLECQLVEADGREHIIIEKAPVLFAGPAPRREELPVSARISCTCVEEKESTVKIDTSKPFGIESTEGQYEFTVKRGSYHAT